MTTKKKTTTRDAVLLDALRSNLNLLGELAVRYAVEFHPERPTGDLPVISCPEDVRRLLGPEMSGLARSNCGCCCSTPGTRVRRVTAA